MAEEVTSVGRARPDSGVESRESEVRSHICDIWRQDRDVAVVRGDCN